nr:MAG TPA: hypothetical protein [Caudoviricetes sp.]
MFVLLSKSLDKDKVGVFVCLSKRLRTDKVETKCRVCPRTDKCIYTSYIYRLFPFGQSVNVERSVGVEELPHTTSSTYIDKRNFFKNKNDLTR